MKREKFDQCLMEECQRIIGYFRRMEDAIYTCLDLTPPQAAVLGALFRVDGPALTDLSAQLGVTKGSLSALCKRMEMQGLITRKRRKGDERFVYMNITPKGREKVEQLQEFWGNFYAAMPDGPSEPREMLMALGRLETYACQSTAECIQFLKDNFH